MANNEKVQFYGTGRRKSSVARVRLVPGNGQIIINGKDSKDYFCKKTLEMIIRQPLVLTETEGRFDVLVNAHGGGTTGQAGAVRLGIARALLKALQTLIGFLFQAITKPLRVSGRFFLYPFKYQEIVNIKSFPLVFHQRMRFFQIACKNAKNAIPYQKQVVSLQEQRGVQRK